MTRRLLPPLVRKEVRALLPTWLTCVLALALAAFVRGGRLSTFTALVYALAAPVYGFGTIVLGAQSIGHEYTDRTLSVLLSQPIARRQLLAAKVGVLAAMLATLALTASMVLLVDARPSWSLRERGLLFMLPLAAISIAPVITILSRGPLAGVVLTMCGCGLLLVCADVIGAWMLDLRGLDFAAFKFRFWFGSMAVSCTAGAILGWRLFMRLEARDDPGAQIELPRLRLLPGVVRHHPIWLLAEKELHLQQLTLVVAGVYLASATAIALLKHVLPELRALPLVPLSILYFILLSMLIGSLASAEERQFGTLEWQVLQPIAASRQWAVKAAVALGTAVVLGVVLPFLVAAMSPSGDDAISSHLWRQNAAIAILLTTCSLYLSSLCGSGVRAMALALPIGMAAGVTLRAIAWAVPRLIELLSIHSRLGILPRGFDAGPLFSFGTAADVLWLAIIAAFVALLLRFAAVNHRTIDRSLARVLRQVACIGAFVTVGAMLLAVG